MVSIYKIKVTYDSGISTTSGFIGMDKEAVLEIFEEYTQAPGVIYVAMIDNSTKEIYMEWEL